MGKCCVQPLALLHLPPHFFIVFLQRLAHFLKGGAQLSQLVLPVINHIEIQIAACNLSSSVFQYGKGFLQLTPIKQYAGNNNKQYEANRINAYAQKTKSIIYAAVFWCKFPKKNRRTTDRIKCCSAHSHLSF